MRAILSELGDTLEVKYILYFLIAIAVSGCSKDDTSLPEPTIEVGDIQEEEEVKLSSEKQMVGFRFSDIESNGLTVEITGEIDEQGKTIAVELPSGTVISALEPNLEIPEKAIFEPTGPQDFSTPINYTITAEDGTSQTYLVTVNVVLSQKQILLLISAANPDNLLNWNESDNLNNWPQVTLNENGIISSLRLQGTNLIKLPPEIGQLKGLRVLQLANNDLDSLPPEIEQLSNLKELDASFNKLNSLPPEIGQLNSLETLKLFINNLESLPPEIGKLSSLEILRLNVNKLESLPTEITQLSNLRELDLSYNNLNQFDHVPFIPADGLGEVSTLECRTETNLRILELRENPSLVELSKCICDLDSENGGSVFIDVIPDGIRCVDNNVIGD